MPQYTLLAAVAVAQAIDELTGKRNTNQVGQRYLLRRKKVCGILSEATSDFESGRIASIVIGIGINFAIPQTAFPEDIQQRATSLFPTGEAPVNRARLIAAVWTRFFDLLDQLPADDYLTIYRQKSFVLGKTVCFTQQGIRYEGVAESITATGELVVRTTDDVKVLSSGEISLEKYS